MRILIVFLFLAAIAGFVMVVARLHPPGVVSIAAGPEGGAYAELAEHYARILSRDDITLNIITTEGSVENAQLIGSGAVDAAFLQGGVDVTGENVQAIGSIFYEPLIFLVERGANIPNNPASWRDLTISSGADGSGTFAAFREFERAVGIPRSYNTHLDLPYEAAVDALIDGSLDIATFVAPLSAPYLREAFDTQGIRAIALDHADAISRRLPHARLVTVPSGGMLLKPVIPPQALDLIALEARLAIDDDLHPALINRLTMAAIELHRHRGIINEADSFPSLQGTGLPVNNAARQLILDGPSAWHDWLPYWIAAQINRVFLLFLPFFFVVLPFLRSLPSAYGYLMRRRVWRHYTEIRQIESDLHDGGAEGSLDEMTERLAELDERLSAMRLPAPYRKLQYDARLHLQLVQNKIASLDSTHATRGAANDPNAVATKFAE